MTAPDPIVLVVEDEDSFVEALTIGLKREGFRVKVARDGAEALDVFGAVEPDGGERFLQPGTRVAYLSQMPDFAGAASVLDYVTAGGAAPPAPPAGLALHSVA